LVLKFFNINIPKDQIFERKKNTPICPAFLDDLTATKEVIFCKSQSFCLTTVLWIFMVLGEARKEGRDKK
jgi:hypothetical protein